MNKEKIKVGSDFSGVGSFNQALKLLGINYDEIFACDMDKYARQTFIHNYGEPSYYPENVYDRVIPTESLDLYMTSPPCQAFSLAGKRKGEYDKRGVLFYNSHDFIKQNKPRYFIFENVKGLLSDDKGNTFAKWVKFLGGKSVNGLPTLFKHDEAVNYHLYWKVLNSKNYGIPQNRERVFLVGIRDDEDNIFTWPKEEVLIKRLKDVLENDVSEKYYLSDKMINGLLEHKDRHEQKGNGFKWEPRNINSTASCLRANAAFAPTDNSIKVYSANNQGFEIATVVKDSINLEHPNSATRRGRVGNKVSKTLTTSCNQGVVEHYDYPKVDFKLTGGKWDKTHEQSGRVYSKNGISPTIHTMQGGYQEPKIGLDYRIRKLTARECFRLMDFPDAFTWSVSDSQAYKQAGNSICVGVLSGIIKKLKL